MTDLRSLVEIGVRYKATLERDTVALSAASRLFETKGVPPASELIKIIEEIPGSADAWMAWSEDKRWSPAWWFDSVGEKYRVGFFSGDDDSSNMTPEIFDIKSHACAAFILREVEDYRRLKSKKR